MICKQFDVVIVPFPFTDLPIIKKRKALVISNETFNRANGASVLLMITSALHSKWRNDVSVSELTKAGLNKYCVVRMKSFTLDNGLLMVCCGKLSSNDRANVLGAFKDTFSLQ